MSTIREQIEKLREPVGYPGPFGLGRPYHQAIDDVLALLSTAQPLEGVFVTEESLARALHRLGLPPEPGYVDDAYFEGYARAILAALDAE